MIDPATVIAELHAEANEALSRGDLERVMEVYAGDVISMPPNQPPLRGRTAVRSMWNALLSAFSVDSSVTVEEVEVAGEWAFERGTYRMQLPPREGGEPVEDEGKYLDIVRRQTDGSWRYVRVSWSSDRPATSGGGAGE